MASTSDNKKPNIPPKPKSPSNSFQIKTKERCLRLETLNELSPSSCSTSNNVPSTSSTKQTISSQKQSSIKMTKSPKPPLLPKPQLIDPITSFKSKSLDKAFSFKLSQALKRNNTSSESKISITHKEKQLTSKATNTEIQSKYKLVANQKNLTLQTNISKISKRDLNTSTSPIRPPRSPKVKTQDPFLSSIINENRPQLPPKSKTLPNFNRKSCVPVPPPRRRKKSFSDATASAPTLKEIPCYAQIDYKAKWLKRTLNQDSSKENRFNDILHLPVISTSSALQEVDSKSLIHLQNNISELKEEVLKLTTSTTNDEKLTPEFLQMNENNENNQDQSQCNEKDTFSKETEKTISSTISNCVTSHNSSDQIIHQSPITETNNSVVDLVNIETSPNSIPSEENILITNSLESEMKPDCSNKIDTLMNNPKSSSSIDLTNEIKSGESDHKNTVITEKDSSSSVTGTKSKFSRGLSRRKSWSTAREKNKEQQKKSTSWCDEGDSTGALADLDSSDNILTNPRERRSLSSWFDSFGKGMKKSKSSTRFYSSTQESSTSLPEICKTEDSERPSSGISETLDNLSNKDDYDHMSTGINDFPHSESEGEDVESCSLTETERKAKKAFFIAQELMTSERVFINVLKLLSVDFPAAIMASKQGNSPVIPDSDLGKIIATLPQLKKLNENLLNDLEKRIENWSEIQKVADVIVKKGPFLKLYTSYIQNFETQCNYLDECCQKYSRFAKVLKEFEASPCCQKLTLKHYMLKPIQRIPQYRLLLEDYLKNLEPDSPDFNDTNTALKIVCDVADHANKTLKQGDHFSKMLQIATQLGNFDIIKPGRSFIKDGELFKLSRKGLQQRYFILFNDCLLCTSYNGSGSNGSLKLNYELTLNGMRVCLPQSEDYRNEFSVISIARSFTLATRSQADRQAWVDALENAIKDYASRQLTFLQEKVSHGILEKNREHFQLGKQAPIWIQDHRVSMCQSCTAQFKVTFRRHHCRACGKVVCGACSDNKAPLQYMKFQAARVCEECHDILLKEFQTEKMKECFQQEMNIADEIQANDTYSNVKILFKKFGSKKIKKNIPQRLKEVPASDPDSQMSGWLTKRCHKSWKKRWFVLKDQVLYEYKASEDIIAHFDFPVLGYQVETMKEKHFQLYEGVDAKLVFQLSHKGQSPWVFYADNEHLANRWINAMTEATVLRE